MRDPFDRSSKWLIGHHGASLLRLGGIRDIRSCRALQAEVTHPRQLPDGLLEAYLDGRSEPDLFLVEVATYPDQRVREQLMRDIVSVFLDRRIVPEVLGLILHSRGQVEIGTAEEVRSRLGTTGLRVSWRVVELWKLSADELLAANDVGLIPWVPLTKFDEPPEVMLLECRRRIDEQASAEEHDNLLTVTQVMTRLRYDDLRYLAFFGGKQVMIESPLILEIVAERMHKGILRVLATRFGVSPADIASGLTTIQDEEKLDALISAAASCADLDEFRVQLRNLQ